jgi:hypothetical protein
LGVADSIVIRIELDESEARDSFKELGSSGEKASQQIKKSFDTEANVAIENLNIKVGDLNKNLNQTEKSAESLSRAFDFFSRLDDIIFDSIENIRTFSNISLNIARILGKDVKFDLGFGDKKIQVDLVETNKQINKFADTAQSLRNIPKEIKPISDRLVEVSEKITEISQKVPSLGGIFTSLGTIGAGSFLLFSEQGKNLISLFKEISKGSILANNNIFELATNFATLSGVFTGVSQLTEGFESDLVAVASSISFTSAAITGLVGVGLSLAIIKAGELGFIIGTKLVSAFQEASSEFIKTISQAQIFEATVKNFSKSADQAEVSSQKWAAVISELSNNLNITQRDLQKASQEILLVGSRLGLTTDQTEQLLRVSAEYAKINKVDVFNSAVAFSSALAGNTQAVLNYGVKLTEASNQLFLIKMAQDTVFTSLTETEKIQVRYNNLLAQYGKVAGIAAVAADSLGDASNRLAVANEKLNKSLGRGAALIEDNNLLISVYASTVDSLNSSILELVGFFGALGSRILQVGGLVLEFSFKIFALVKAVKILNIVLASDFAQSNFAKTIPLIGASINQLAEQIVGAGFKIKNSRDLLTFFVGGLSNLAQSLGLIQVVGGKSILSFSNLVSVALGRITDVLKFIAPAFRVALVALAPFAVQLGLIAGAFLFLKKAFVEIEDRTSAFTEIFSIFLDELKRSDGVFGFITSSFRSFVDFFSNLLNQAIGVLVFFLSKFLELSLKIAQLDPFGVFSKNSLDRLKGVQARLEIFNKELVAADFNLKNFGSRTLASETVEKDLNSLIEKLSEVRRALEEETTSPLEKLQNQFNDRLKILNEALANELITIQEFNRLKLLAEESFREQRKKILEQAVTDQKEATDAIGSSVDSALRRAVSSLNLLGQALVRGSVAFKEFGKAILGIFGDLLIEIGTGIVVASKAVEAFRNTLVTLFGGFGIAGGLALIAFGGVLKAYAGGGGLGGVASGAGGAGFVGNPAAPDVDTDSIESDRARIAVNIQGSVFDTKDTGLRIVEIINDAFDTQGATVTARA